jgi:hypothetical protein
MMPPHCDAMDGPVVREARRALEIGRVEVVLPDAPETAEAEIRKAFDLAATARTQGEEAKETSELYSSRPSCGSTEPVKAHRTLA